MVRYAAAASWLLLSANRIGVWAVDVLPAVDVDGNNDLEPAEQPAASIGSDGDGDSSIGNSIVSTEPIAPDADTTSSTVWSWPDAIVKATAKEPLSDWKEYLFQDPFGANDDSVESTSAMFPRPVSDPDQLNWNDGGGGGGVRGKGWPSITCPYGGAMQVEDYGHRQCIGVGQGLCKDGWRFGISHYGDTTYLMLWREDNPAYPVVRWFPGATTLCIGEQYPNVAYLRVTYEDCLYYLIGPGAGSADNLARLKIVDDTQKFKPDDVIVKFRDGPGDQNTLLQIFASGFSRTSPDAMWYPMPCETASPSSSPSSSPSGRPSSSPSASPTSSPTANPSASPSSSPSDAPSSAPSTLAVSIVPVPYFIKLIVFSRLPIRANQLYFCLFSYDRTVRCHLRSFHMSLRRPGNALRSMIFLPVALKYLAWELMTMRKLILEKSLPFTPSRYRGTASS